MKWCTSQFVQVEKRDRYAPMEDTLPPLIERALRGQPGFLAFYLHNRSRLLGTRASLELAQNLSNRLAQCAPDFPAEIRSLLDYLLRDGQQVVSTTAGEFILMCGVLSLGTCAAVMPEWREEAFTRLAHHAQNSARRVRDGVALALQKMLSADPAVTLERLINLLKEGDCLQMRACVATISETTLLTSPPMIMSALVMQRISLEYLHALPMTERKRADVRVLRQALGYTLSVVTVASPDDGFALMYEMATWNDPDINWVLRENLKKRRLAKFRDYADKVIDLMV